MSTNISSFEQLEKYYTFVDKYLEHLEIELNKNPHDLWLVDKHGKVTELRDVLRGQGNYLGEPADVRIKKFYELINKYQDTLTTRRNNTFSKFLAFFKADKWFEENFGAATIDGVDFVKKVGNMKQELDKMTKSESDEVSLEDRSTFKKT